MDEITGEPEVLAKEIGGPIGKRPADQIFSRSVTMDLLVIPGTRPRPRCG